MDIIYSGKSSPYRKRTMKLPKVLVDDINVSNQTFGYQVVDYNLPEIWKNTQGEGVLIGVLDTGAQLNHVDLKSCFVKHEKNVNDKHGHGTHVVGIISANNDSKGIVGVAPKAKILAVKVLNDNGSGSSKSVANGIYYAIEKGCNIISMSLGASTPMPDVHKAIQTAYKKGIPIICAAGNAGDTNSLDWPAAYPETISVGAVDIKKTRAWFSQTSRTLDFVAPGVNILSTVPTNNYARYSGTSMATPWVAGVVALIISKHKQLGGATPIKTVEDIREHLKKSAIDIHDLGRDKYSGWGIIDVEKAIHDLSPKPQPGKIEIVKINIDPEGKDANNLNNEWIEIQNTGGTSVSLKNWTISDLAGWNYVFKDVVIEPKNSIKLRTGVGEDTKTDVYWNYRRPILNNTGEVVILKNDKNEMISRFEQK